MDSKIRVDTKVSKCKLTEQANSISIHVHIDILSPYFGSFAFRYFGSELKIQRARFMTGG